MTPPHGHESGIDTDPSDEPSVSMSGPLSPLAEDAGVETRRRHVLGAVTFDKVNGIRRELIDAGVSGHRLMTLLNHIMDLVMEEPIFVGPHEMYPVSQRGKHKAPYEHLNFLDQVFDLDRGMLAKKDIEYGASWKRRGGPGAMFMVLRKTDRLEEGVKRYNYDLFQFLMENHDRIDDVTDMRRYLALIEAWYLSRMVQVSRSG